MSDYDNLVQWCKDMRSTQIARRNRAWNFQHAHGIEPCDVAWNADAIRWVDGVVYVSAAMSSATASWASVTPWSRLSSGLTCIGFRAMSHASHGLNPT